MTTGIDGITTATLGLALDAAALRQQAIANNIANATTAGYVRQTTSFDRQVEQLRQALGSHQSPKPELFSNVALRLEPVASGADAQAGVQLDMEVADMAQNATHYQTLLKGLIRHYAILSSAVSEGKR
jgi:flagellar basal-body rod protein FlgB